MAKRAQKTSRKTSSKSIQYTVSSGNIFKDAGYPNPEEAKLKWDLIFLTRKFVQQLVESYPDGISETAVSQIPWGRK